MAGLVVRPLSERLGITLDAMYFDIDGDFPHHLPTPIEPASTLDMTRRVRETSADLGVIFDGDGDRVCICDELGRMFSGT